MTSIPILDDLRTAVSDFVAGIKPKEDDHLPPWVWPVGGLVVMVLGVFWLRWEQQRAAARRERVRSMTEVAPPVRELWDRDTGGPSEPARATSAEQPAKADNLRRVKGIGPKTMALLNEAGIMTFEQLAAAEFDFLRSLLDSQDWHYIDPSNWPEQARRLADD